MTYTIILGLLSLLSLKGVIGSIRQTGKYWRSAGTIRIAGSNQLHRVELEPGVDPWTLFFPGPVIREWGFMKKGKWVQHEKYLAERYKN